MIKIEYQIKGKTIETHYKQTMSIAKWYAKTLRLTHRIGTFKFSEV
jgi:hypothetical protein